MFFDRVAIGVETHQITSDNFKGAFDAIELLINEGFKKIAYLTTSNNLLISRERLEGYHAALNKHHIPVKPAYIKYCNHGGMIKEDVENAVSGLLKMDTPPDVIFTANDRLTTSCMFTIKKFGLKIPEDVAVAGFTNSDVAELYEPALTVVRQTRFPDRGR